jgi:hypothetical protein
VAARPALRARLNPRTFAPPPAAQPLPQLARQRFELGQLPAAGIGPGRPCSSSRAQAPRVGWARELQRRAAEFLIQPPAGHAGHIAEVWRPYFEDHF